MIDRERIAADIMNAEFPSPGTDIGAQTLIKPWDGPPSRLGRVHRSVEEARAKVLREFPTEEAMLAAMSAMDSRGLMVRLSVGTAAQAAETLEGLLEKLDEYSDDPVAKATLGDNILLAATALRAHLAPCCDNCRAGTGDCDFNPFARKQV